MCWHAFNISFLISICLNRSRSVIQDSFDYKLKVKLEKNKNGTAKNYPMGQFDNVSIVVNPYMRWDDNRILLKNNENIIHELEIIDENDMLI